MQKNVSFDLDQDLLLTLLEEDNEYRRRRARNYLIFKQKHLLGRPKNMFGEVFSGLRLLNWRQLSLGLIPILIIILSTSFWLRKDYLNNLNTSFEKANFAETVNAPVLDQGNLGTRNTDSHKSASTENDATPSEKTTESSNSKKQEEMTPVPTKTRVEAETESAELRQNYQVAPINGLDNQDNAKPLSVSVNLQDDSGSEYMFSYDVADQKLRYTAKILIPDGCTKLKSYELGLVEEKIRFSYVLEVKDGMCIQVISYQNIQGEVDLKLSEAQQENFAKLIVFSRVLAQS